MSGDFFSGLLAAGHPVISVDAKKKELIGNFKNQGQAWCRQAEVVNVHDFRHDAEGRAVPYGIYDLTHNEGYVVVGISADTSEFAVDAICMWWEAENRPTFPDESMLHELRTLQSAHKSKWMLWEGKPLAETVRLLEEMGIQSAVLDPCGNRPNTGDFIEVMKQNLSNLRQIYK